MNIIEAINKLNKMSESLLMRNMNFNLLGIT